MGMVRCWEGTTRVLTGSEMVRLVLMSHVAGWFEVTLSGPTQFEVWVVLDACGQKRGRSLNRSVSHNMLCLNVRIESLLGF